MATSKNTPTATTNTGAQKDDRDENMIVGQTLAQARENGRIGGQIVKEAVARGLQAQQEEEQKSSKK